jgi:hypothetical protein
MKEQTGKYSIAEGHMLKSIPGKCAHREAQGSGFITFRNIFLSEITQRESRNDGAGGVLTKASAF